MDKFIYIRVNLVFKVLLVVVFQTSYLLNAQTIAKNIHVEQIGKSINISYDLESSYLKNTKITYYLVKLYYSTNKGDTFIQVIENVTGDIGKVRAEKNKTIIWQVSESLDYIGEIQIELRCIEELPKTLNFADLRIAAGAEFMMSAGLSWSILGKSRRDVYNGIQICYLRPISEYDWNYPSIALAYKRFNPKKNFSFSYGLSYMNSEGDLISPIWSFFEIAYVSKSVVIPINLSLLSANSVLGIGIGFKF